MARRGALLLAAALLAGCAATGAGPAPVRAPDFRPVEVRQPAVVLRVTVDPRAFGDRRTTLPADYEGALLDALNARAVVVRDVTLLPAGTGRLDTRAALARAREVGADHAVVVDVRATRGIVTICQEGRRALRGEAALWRQDVEVLRVSDGATRLRVVDNPSLTVTDVDIDCDAPKEARRHSVEETLAAAVERLLSRILLP